MAKADYKNNMTDDNSETTINLLPPPGPLRAQVLFDMMTARGKAFFKAAVLQVTLADMKASYGVTDIPDTFYKSSIDYLSEQYDFLLQKFDELKPNNLNNLRKTMEPLGVNDINPLSDAMTSLIMRLFVIDEKKTTAESAKRIAEQTVPPFIAQAMSSHTAVARMLDRVVTKFNAGFPMDVAIRLAREPKPAPQSATILKLPVRPAAARRGVKPDGSFDPS